MGYYELALMSLAIYIAVTEECFKLQRGEISWHVSFHIFDFHRKLNAL